MSVPAKPKNKTVLILLIIVGLLAAAFLAFHLWQKWKEKKALQESSNLSDGNNNVAPPKSNNTTISTPSANANISINSNDSFPLKEGSYGSNVKYLQMAMNKLITNNAFKVPTDGQFTHSMYLNLITGLGTKYYPVTQSLWTELMNKANSK